MLHDFAANSFDVIYSRDTILHIADKMSLFSRFYVSWRSRMRCSINDGYVQKKGLAQARRSIIYQRLHVCAEERMVKRIRRVRSATTIQSPNSGRVWQSKRRTQALFDSTVKLALGKCRLHPSRCSGCHSEIRPMPRHRTSSNG